MITSDYNVFQDDPHTYTYVDDLAWIHPAVIIEPGVYIGPYCTIGGMAEKKGSWAFGKVRIKRGAILTKKVNVDSGTEGETVISEGCYLMVNAHIGHDAHLGMNVTVSSHAIVGGHCNIGHGCNLGLNSCIHQRVTVPPYCMIGANAFVPKNVELKPFGVYVGVPAYWKKFNHVGIERAGLTDEEVTAIMDKYVKV